MDIVRRKLLLVTIGTYRVKERVIALSPSSDFVRRSQYVETKKVLSGRFLSNGYWGFVDALFFCTPIC